jgi:hypothetical protein
MMLLTQIKLLEGRLQRDDVYLVLLEGITDRDAAGTNCMYTQSTACNCASDAAITHCVCVCLQSQFLFDQYIMSMYLHRLTSCC